MITTHIEASCCDAIAIYYMFSCVLGVIFTHHSSLHKIKKYGAFVNFILINFRYSNPKNRIEAVRVVDWLCAKLHAGQLTTPPCENVPFDQYQTAIKESMDFTGPKQLLVFAEK